LSFVNDLKPVQARSSSFEGKRIAKLLLPSIVLEMRRALLISLDTRPPWMEFAPDGWDTELPPSQQEGWNSERAVETERAKWEAFRRQLEGTGPLAFSHEHTDLSAINVSFHNINMNYAYVLALATGGRDTVSVLDYGGSLGHYYSLARALFPRLALDFHCKEVPRTAELGQRVNPAIHWYSDDSCLEREYDLVMVNGVLQYLANRATALARFAAATRQYLFLGQLPLLQRHPGFVAIQRHYGSVMLHEQFNRQKLQCEAEGHGLRLVREFVTGYRPPIKNAPEQCELRSWLFARKSR
jgi:putative methyltransferase (TIGR04325 family)